MTIRPKVAWVLSDSANRVYFRPGCVVDLTSSLRDQTVDECETGCAELHFPSRCFTLKVEMISTDSVGMTRYTDETFSTPISAASDSNGSNGIGMNNRGNFCSIRAFLDQVLARDSLGHLTLSAH